MPDPPWTFFFPILVPYRIPIKAAPERPSNALQLAFMFFKAKLLLVSSMPRYLMKVAYLMSCSNLILFGSGWTFGLGILKTESPF